MWKDNDALTCTLFDIDLKLNLRLKKNILRSFESYKEETKSLFMKMKFKNKNLEDELENQNNEIGRLKSELAREQENIDKSPKELEDTRRNNIGLRTQHEEAKIIEEAMKLQWRKKRRQIRGLKWNLLVLERKLRSQKLM